MKKEEFYIPSGNKENLIHCICWIPEEKICGVVQLVHGMVEYMDRYHDFACYLTEQGFAVIGHDHLGHGRSASCDEELGFFAEKDGYKYALADMYSVTQEGKKRWPNLPVFLLGHSMGSFFVRRYVTLYGAELAGAVIMGTGYYPLALTRAGKGLAKLMCATQGAKKRSELLYRITLGSNNRGFEETHPLSGWITKDVEIVERYSRDKFCTFRFTNSAYFDLFSLLEELAQKIDMELIPKSLPIFFVAGQDDPVGAKGEGVKTVYREFQALGLKEVSMKLYEGDRHEILNETDRQVVYRDLANWFSHHL